MTDVETWRERLREARAERCAYQGYWLATVKDVLATRAAQRTAKERTVSSVDYDDVRDLTPHQVTLRLDGIAYDVRKTGLHHQADELVELATRVGQFENVTSEQVQAAKEAFELRLAKGATT